MLKLENNGDSGRKWPRVCDTCMSAACAVYCRADMAYLCTSCDARIHAAADTLISCHERVWVCEACECAPAAFLCKADAASLCTSCDADIHSANPLARRHHRVPIMPIQGLLYGPSANSGALMTGDDEEEEEGLDEEDEDEAASWLLTNPIKIGRENNQTIHDHGSLFGEETDDQYINLEDYNPPCPDHDHHHDFQFNLNTQLQQQYSDINDEHQLRSCGYGGDSVVPFQVAGFNRKDAEFSNSTSLISPKQVSFSSVLDVGVVPQSNAGGEISQSRPTKGTIDLFSGPPAAQQLTQMDREARVLRYREKKKARKFEKTIRYASRKAYAETRPRIKGRFAKRRDVDQSVEGGDHHVDQIIFSTSSHVISADSAFGMVPASIRI